MLKDILTFGKDKAVSFLILTFINEKIKEYGEVKEVKLDSKNKNIYIQLYLKGESENVLMCLRGYEIICLDKEYFFYFKDISVSKLWIDKLIKNVIIPKYALGNKVLIPKKYEKIILLLNKG
ncbi:hypothetical protein [Desulfonauticus submarinus]